MGADTLEDQFEIAGARVSAVKQELEGRALTATSDTVEDAEHGADTVKIAGDCVRVVAVGPAFEVEGEGAVEGARALQTTYEVAVAIALRVLAAAESVVQVVRESTNQIQVQVACVIAG
ncbi:hypothetical protein [Streptomyces sp. NPDC050546]|uniref:hypothetical protein n=1 Tax=Streptomyces sp. NPDC050546 TaxID=3365628 RepID=UPI0037B00983